VVFVLQLPFELVRWVSLAVIILFGAINYFGVKLGSLTQIIFTIAKLVPIVIIIGLGLFLGTQTVDLSLTSPTPDVDLGLLLSGFTFAIARTLFAYEGWTNLNTVAGEMKNPKRDLPLALLISVGLVTVVYVLFIFALYRVLDVPFLIEQVPLGVNNQAIFFAVGTVLQGNYFLWVMIAILISILGAINGTLLAFPRVYFAMAEDGTMPKVLSHTSKFGTPDVAILGSVAMASVLLFFDIDTLLTFVLLPALVFNTLIFFSVFIFRKTMPNAERPYRVWGYTVDAAMAILGMVILIYYTFENSFIPSLIGLGVLTLGWFVYPFIFKKQR
jgi:APA family basic amino acid/polyamine antiporter